MIKEDTQKKFPAGDTVNLEGCQPAQPQRHTASFIIPLQCSCPIIFIDEIMRKNDKINVFQTQIILII